MSYFSSYNSYSGINILTNRFFWLKKVHAHANVKNVHIKVCLWRFFQCPKKQCLYRNSWKYLVFNYYPSIYYHYILVQQPKKIAQKEKGQLVTTMMLCDLLPPPSGQLSTSHFYKRPVIVNSFRMPFGTNRTSSGELLEWHVAPMNISEIRHFLH